jgi:hypothetical protein
MTILWGTNGTDTFVREPGRTAGPSASPQSIFQGLGAPPDRHRVQTSRGHPGLEPNSTPSRLSAAYRFLHRLAGESKLDVNVELEYLFLIVDKIVGHYFSTRFLFCLRHAC